MGDTPDKEKGLYPWKMYQESRMFTLGVTEQIYYRWRREYGGVRVEQA